LDRLATGLPQEELQRIEEAFITSSRFEYAFWDMAHRLERWPV
jgi:thiaminase/transcriptional activator TenA